MWIEVGYKTWYFFNEELWRKTMADDKNAVAEKQEEAEDMDKNTVEDGESDAEEIEEAEDVEEETDSKVE